MRGLILVMVMLAGCGAPIEEAIKIADAGADAGGAQPGCRGDSDCSPPATICDEAICEPSCTAYRQWSCPQGEGCDTATGRCLLPDGGNP